MKISPISNHNQLFGTKKVDKKHQKQKGVSQQPQSKLPSFKELGSRMPNLNIVIKSKRDYENLKIVKDNFTPEAEGIYELGIDIAKNAHSPELETWHLYLASLMHTTAFLKRADANPIILDAERSFATPIALTEEIYPGCSVLRDDEKRKEIIDVIDKHIGAVCGQFVAKDIEKNPKTQLIPPVLSKKSIADLYTCGSRMAAETSFQEFYDSYFFYSSLFSQDKKLAKEANQLIFDLQEIVMREKISDDEKYHIEFYDGKADVIWKNIAAGNNVMIVNNESNAEGYDHLVRSFTNLINKPGQNYGNIKPENTEIIKLSGKITPSYLTNLIKKVKYNQDKVGKNTVIMFDMVSHITNAENDGITTELVKLYSEAKKYNAKESNIYFVTSISPECYQKNISAQGVFGKAISTYALQTLPVLSASDAKKYLTNESGLNYIKSEVKKDVQRDAVLKAIEVTSSKNGNYPDKAVSLLSAVAKFFVDEKEITPKHVVTYIEETKNLSEVTDADDRDIIFDTGKTLIDIKGMPMTLASAKTIVNRIKCGRIGTDGYVISHSSGSSYGGGRRHTAEAICGETGIPMLIMDAQEFAAKEIDRLSMDPNYSNQKIKTLVQSAKAQAEANDLKTAMIYINNFDYFASNPLHGVSSVYEQKAFSQLQKEMDAIRKEGKVNLIVVGSMNMPEILDENVMKPHKFLNQIEVFQPTSPEERLEILEYYIDKMNLKLAGKTKEEQQENLKLVSESTKGFSVVDLMYLLEEANNVSKDRNKESIDNLDFIEGILQIYSGRTNTAGMSEHVKKIVTSHEFGHALNTQIMYDLMNKQEKPWRLPKQVDFVTIDPRGWYMGAMYPKSSKNEESNFETMMSNIVCSYGGYSTEKIIYDMDGSWGITSDMEHVTEYAKTMVYDMGLGKRTATRHIPRNALGSADVSPKTQEMIEDDIEDIAKAGKEISDLIIDTYKDFILELTEEYSSKVATGECLIPSSVFKQKLQDWVNKQTPEKLQEIQEMEELILDVINETKTKK